jgi:hypothetical protein
MPLSGEASKSMAPDPANFRTFRSDVMQDQVRDNEGGHMSSTAGRITYVGSGELPYLVVLSHHGSEATEHSFATMREAEAFIKRNTPPVSARSLSALYDRPSSDL